MMNLRRDIFQALADPSRRAILLLLAAQPLTAGAIANNFTFSRPTISKHIKILAECELVKSNAQGREIYYEVNSEKIDEIDDWVAKFRNIWKSRFDKLDDVLNNLKNSNNEK